MAKQFSKNFWFLNIGEDLILQEKIKRKWVILYGIEVSTPYGIYEGTIATYGFVSTTNHYGKMIRSKRKEILQNRESQFIIQGFSLIKNIIVI